jgi:carbonic anhydrase
MKLIQSTATFQNRITTEQRDLFASLADGQSPEALMITCADSRIVPTLFTDSGPGDLFMVRNVGNMVPPAPANGSATGLPEVAALEYGIQNLEIGHVIVCGHSGCGAMQAVLGGSDMSATHPELSSWLAHANASKETFDHVDPKAGDFSEVDQLSQLNVLQQIEHLKSWALVRKRFEAGTLTLHAWWYRISDSQVFSWNDTSGKFEVIKP